MSPNIQIKQYGMDGFDIEHVCVEVSATPSPLDDVVMSPPINDDGSERHAMESVDRRGKFANLMSSVAVNKKTATLALMALGVMLGASVYGVIEHNQQQQSLASVIASNSKAGKAVSFCESEPAISCGATFNNEKVVLSEDLFCVDVVEDTTTTRELRTMNAALELTGADAVLDCKGHTIHQVSGADAVNCDQGIGVNRGRFDGREQMKENCNLFYQGGILLRDGAKAINCKVQQFYDGFIVMDGSEVTKSEAFGNRRGVLVDHKVGSSESEKAKISDVYVHGNNVGVRVHVRPASESAFATAFEEDNDDDFTRSNFDNQDNTTFSPSALAETNDVNVLIPAASADTVVEIKDITSKYNIGNGMRLKGPGGITVKDSTSSYNGKSGIVIRGRAEEESATEVQFKGSVSSHDNDGRGISIQDDYSKVFVTGELNIYLNKRDGLGVSGTSDSAFVMDGRGTVNSCLNVEYDILIRNSPNIIFEGTGDTCYDKAVKTTGPINVGECTNQCPLCA